MSDMRRFGAEFVSPLRTTNIAAGSSKSSAGSFTADPKAGVALCGDIFGRRTPFHLSGGITFSLSAAASRGKGQQFVTAKHQSSTLRSNSVLLKSQVSTLNDDRDQLERDLIRAKKTLDRQRMDFDRAQQEWSLSRDQEKGNGTPKNSGSGHATPNGKAEEVREQG